MTPHALSLLLCVALVAPATAQPVTQPSRCEVTIARAPDAVRVVIESWVRSEPRCSTSLELRIVATTGGLYLLARDSNGRTRERVVPDADSAGALVASWMADDTIEPTARRNSGDARDGRSIDADRAPATGSMGGRVEAPPASVHVTPPRRIETRVLGSPERSPAAAGDPAVVGGSLRWLTLGGMVQLHGGGAFGARGELDVMMRGRWRFAVGLTASGANLPIQGNGYLETRDIRAIASLARVSTFGRWELRVAAGAGLVHTSVNGEIDSDPLGASGAFPAAEISALFARRFGTAWAIAAGPVVTWYSQSYEMFGGITIHRRDMELMAFAGLRHRM
jgi:hypothetical protein